MVFFLLISFAVVLGVLAALMIYQFVEKITSKQNVFYNNIVLLVAILVNNFVFSQYTGNEDLNKIWYIFAMTFYVCVFIYVFFNFIKYSLCNENTFSSVIINIVVSYLNFLLLFSLEYYLLYLCNTNGYCISNGTSTNLMFEFVYYSFMSSVCSSSNIIVANNYLPKIFNMIQISLNSLIIISFIGTVISTRLIEKQTISNKNSTMEGKNADQKIEKPHTFLNKQKSSNNKSENQ